MNTYPIHYHREPNHHGLGNKLIGPGEEAGLTKGEIECRERLGEILSYYFRKAA